MKKTYNEELQERKPTFKALIPFLVFIIFYLGFSLVIHDFTKVPMAVAFIIASAVALTLNHKEKLSKKIEFYAIGMGHKDIMLMCMIFILAGAFTATAQAIGAVEAAVVIAQNLIPQQYMIAGLFVIASLISLAIGTSCGTIAALVPIAVSLSSALGLNAGIAVGAIVGGAMFGDNLSLISDTTIAATRTQNVEMRDKMICNFKIVIVPSILTVLIYASNIFTNFSGQIEIPVPDIQSYIKILPYIFLLVLGIAGKNVMFLLLSGIALNSVIGLYYGSFGIGELFGLIGQGTESMASIIIVAMLAGGLLQMVRYNGGITYIINTTSGFIKSKKLCELGICTLVGLTNLFTANNTVAIITAGPIAKELSRKYELNPKRVASLLDITSCCVQGIIPYGAQILIATGLAATLSVSSFSIIKGAFYPFLVGLTMIISIIFSKQEKA